MRPFGVIYLIPGVHKLSYQLYNARHFSLMSGQNPKNSPLPLRTGGYDEPVPVGVCINTPPDSDSSRKRHKLSTQQSRYHRPQDWDSTFNYVSIDILGRKHQRNIKANPQEGGKIIVLRRRGIVISNVPYFIRAHEQGLRFQNFMSPIKRHNKPKEAKMRKKIRSQFKSQLTVARMVTKTNTYLRYRRPITSLIVTYLEWRSARRDAEWKVHRELEVRWPSLENV